jgi:C4-dicarboxylate transporter DctQ subunit
MSFFKNLLQKINSFVEYIVCVLLAVMVVVVFLQVIFRFVIHSSLPWSEELSRYLMVWIVFLGASIGVNKKSHIGVEALVILLPAVVQKWAAALVSALCCVFFAFMIQYGGLILRVVVNQLSPAMEISMAVPYSALLAGGALMFAHCFYQMFEQAADALSARTVKS